MKIPSVPHLQVELQMNGTTMKEYDLSDDSHTDPPATGTKFVEAEPGREWNIRFRIEPRIKKPPENPGVAVHICCDGKWLFARHIQSQYIRSVHTCTWGTVALFVKDAWVDAKLCFGDLLTHDGAITPGKKPQDFEGLGEIVVECCWVASTVLSTTVAKEQAHRITDAEASVAEKALKGRAISSQVVLGAQTALASAPLRSNLSYIHGWKNPFAKFTFRYRSKADLQIEGIIPREPSPVPLEERDPETLTLEEAREIARRNRERLQRQEAENVPLKRETGVRVKRERSEPLRPLDPDDEDVSFIESRPKRQRVSGAGAPGAITIEDD
ncbi:hypothetical protein MBLNU230_g1922t1 [Neophaeotheca triangularis]